MKPVQIGTIEIYMCTETKHSKIFFIGNIYVLCFNNLAKKSTANYTIHEIKTINIYKFSTFILVQLLNHLSYDLSDLKGG